MLFTIYSSTRSYLHSSFIGLEGLKDQAKLIQPMKSAGVQLFVPSDLALPYTAEERRNVQVPREKRELEDKLKANSIPFVLICIGNFTSFALDSPYVHRPLAILDSTEINSYMNIDIPNHRIVHIGNSKHNAVWLWYVSSTYHVRSSGLISPTARETTLLPASCPSSPRASHPTSPDG